MKYKDSVSEGDVVSLHGEKDEWLVESITSGNDAEITFFNKSTGDFIQLDLIDGVYKIDKIIATNTL